MKLSKDKRDKLILLSLAFIGVVGVLYTFVLGVQQDRLAALNKAILITRDKLAKAERLVKNKDTIEGDLHAVRQVLDKREEFMAPEGQYYYWFLKLMEQFREQENLDPSFITDITQPEFLEAGLVPGNPYKAASFGLRLSGQYHEVGRFLADLENTFPYLRVQGMKMFPGVTAAPAKPVPSGAAPDGGALIVELRVVALIRGGGTT